MKKLVLIPLIAMIVGLGACETVPYQDRAALYHKEVSAKYVGRSSDNVILDFGPPSSTYPLSEGREMLQYETRREGYTQRTSGYVSIGSGWGWGGGWRHRSYPFGGVGVNFPITGNYNSKDMVCAKRFIVNKAKIVESFAFEGRECVK